MLSFSRNGKPLQRFRVCAWRRIKRLRISVTADAGKVLTGLMRQIDRSQTAMNVSDEDSLQRVSNLFAAASKD